MKNEVQRTKKKLAAQQKGQDEGQAWRVSEDIDTSDDEIINGNSSIKWMQRKAMGKYRQGSDDMSSRSRGIASTGNKRVKSSHRKREY